MSYLTFKSNDPSGSSQIIPKFSAISGITPYLQYRTVGSTTWKSVASGDTITFDSNGIEMRGKNIKMKTTLYAYGWKINGQTLASGDVTSLVDYSTGGDQTLSREIFYRMFYNCPDLISAPNLPSTTLGINCYQEMFCGCTGLTDAPALPATNLKSGCYMSMFEGCTGLTEAPTLPATDLQEGCYQKMFYGCTSLTIGPILPATTMASYCCFNMFGNCTSLMVPSALPATTLSTYCYSKMFSGCTSLVGILVQKEGFNLIHNHPTPTGTETDWNTNMYENMSPASTVPTTPSSGVNYYFRSALPGPITIVGKQIDSYGQYAP